MNIELEKSKLMKLLEETNDESIIASIKKIFISQKNIFIQKNNFIIGQIIKHFVIHNIIIKVHYYYFFEYEEKLSCDISTFFY